MTRRRIGMLIVAALAVGYGAVLTYVKVNETALVFHPELFDGHTMRTPADSLHVQPLRLRAADSTWLTAWAMPVADTTAPWILYYHGNAGNISYERLLDFYARWRSAGASVLAVDYRSYGTSEVRPLSEAGVYLDARAAYDYLRTVRHVPAERIVIYGHSLGSGIATKIASEVDAAGLIIEGAFTSVPDRGAEIYPWLPIRAMASNRFASIERIDRISMPKLLLHAVDDAQIPISHGRALCAAASAPKECVEFPRGGHMDAFRDNPEFWDRAPAFVARVTAPGPTGESPPPIVPPASH